MGAAVQKNKNIKSY